MKEKRQQRQAFLEQYVKENMHFSRRRALAIGRKLWDRNKKK